MRHTTKRALTKIFGSTGVVDTHEAAYPILEQYIGRKDEFIADKNIDTHNRQAFCDYLHFHDYKLFERQAKKQDPILNEEELRDAITKLQKDRYNSWTVSHPSPEERARRLLGSTCIRQDANL